MDGLFTLLKEFDFEKMLPELDGYVTMLKVWSWLLVMVGPVLILVLGILYWKRPPEDMDCRWAFSNRLTRSDPEIWQAAHALAGKIWTIMGGVLSGAGAICGVVFLWLEALAATTVAMWVIGVELVAILASWIIIMLQLRKV